MNEKPDYWHEMQADAAPSELEIAEKNIKQLQKQISAKDEALLELKRWLSVKNYEGDPELAEKALLTMIQSALSNDSGNDWVKRSEVAKLESFRNFAEIFNDKLVPFYFAKHRKLPPLDSGLWELLAFIESSLNELTVSKSRAEKAEEKVEKEQKQCAEMRAVIQACLNQALSCESSSHDKDSIEYLRKVLFGDAGKDWVRREDWEAYQRSLAEMRVALERIVSPYSPAEIEEMKTLHHGRSAGEISIKDVLVCIEALNLNQPSQDWVRKSELLKVKADAVVIAMREKSRAEAAEERVKELENIAGWLRESVYDLGGYGRCDCNHPACRRCLATKDADIVLEKAKCLVPELNQQSTLAKEKESK